MQRYEIVVGDILSHPKVQEMRNYKHHASIDCLEHSLYVSKTAYKVAGKLNLDAKSVARGALLHDFYLYDWHVEGSHEGLHGFNHAALALENATAYFELNPLERDIIEKHMWPLNLRFPSYVESYIVMVVDKYCTVMETLNLFIRRSIK